MENNFKMSELGFWVPVRESCDSEGQASSTPVEHFGEARSEPGRDKRTAHPTSADTPDGRAGASIYRMSESGFWVRVEQASNPPSQIFAETRNSRGRDGATRNPPSDMPTGRAGASIYRMSESGFWVPVHESRDSNSADDVDSQEAQLEKFAAAWDPRKHPRGGFEENRGWFSPVAGASSSRVAAWGKHAGLTKGVVTASPLGGATDADGQDEPKPLRKLRYETLAGTSEELERKYARRAKAADGADPAGSDSDSALTRQETADFYADVFLRLGSLNQQIRASMEKERKLGRAVSFTPTFAGLKTGWPNHTVDWNPTLDFLIKRSGQLDELLSKGMNLASGLYNGAGSDSPEAVQDSFARAASTLLVLDSYNRLIHAGNFAVLDAPPTVIGKGLGFNNGLLKWADYLATDLDTLKSKKVEGVGNLVGHVNNYINDYFDGIQEGAKWLKVAGAVSLVNGNAGLARGIYALSAAAGRAVTYGISGGGGLALAFETGTVVAVSRAEIAALASAGFSAAAGGPSLLFASKVDPKGLGRAAERAVPGKQNTTRIPSASGRREYRVPDRLNKVGIEEIKNHLKLEFRSQLQDYLDYARKTGRTFKIWVRGNASGAQTKLTPALLDLVKSKRIRIQAIPGTGTWVPP
jgi:hypothetical protein